MVSRPLRELPPAFLCAIVHSWSRVSLAFNASDFHFGETLAVALSFLKMLTSVEFDDFYLAAAALFQYFSSHLSAFNVRCTNFNRFPFPDHKNPVEGDFITGTSFQLLKLKYLAFRHSVLFATAFDYRVHNYL